MRLSKHKLSGFIALIMGLFASSALADYTLNMPKGVTPISNDIYHLHMMAIYVCAGIGLVVFSVLIYALIFHRKSRGYQPASFHEHPALEVTWAIIPFFILVAMAIPATKVLLHLEDNTQAEVNIKVTGYQWKWKYDYIDEGVSFFSSLSTPAEQTEDKVATKNEWYLREVDNPLVVPVGKKIRFLITANDVIHSWWVPELGVKKDGIPGFIHETWAKIDVPGTYRGQCAELCGAKHGFMPIVVEAKSEEEYRAWLATQGAVKAEAEAQVSRNWTLDELMKQGKTVYEKACAICHKADGSGMPPAFPAMVKSPIATGKLADHINIVVHGKNGTAMQAFGSQLSDADIAAVITYERNAWGNDMGDSVQPKDITSAKQ